MQHAAGRVSVMAPALRASGGPRVLIVADGFRSPPQLRQPQPRWLASSLLLLSPRAASPLRAYTILNYTLGKL
ncbi:hypothetical protein SFRURICE_008618 [Spodoptera frugiperda]|nr:hypothetical protein SFRURICE_008618 [Spodoptera frugiperda]